ncbi:BAG family molecular chaperone regulator 8, chloroplastic [Euphorbia lathyris]|uniref:BAG family molecular chaperone regulator 8, chloroplastic n=1 Tax=Euphorbia lathyris TaxID=212925 RepID=UPI003313A28D
MASHHPYNHHHHHHHHHSQNPIPAPCNCHYNDCCSQSSPPPQHLSIDPILQALSLLLQRQQPNHHAHLNKHQARKNPHHNLQFQAQKLHSELLGEDELTHSHSVISSLLQRISSLETSLAHFHASSSSNKHRYPSYSLREAAARVIQAHFRAFLVRRSRTLSQLQDLAFIKSSFNSLKSSISNRNHFNYGSVSQKAMDLLHKLDSIQGGDPMIRDGKRSISGNIVRFLEYIDAITVKRHERSCKPVKNVRFVRNSNTSRALNSNGHFSVPQKELVEKLSERVEKIRGFSRVFDNDEEDVELEGFQEFIDDDDNDEEEKPEYHRVLVDGKHNNSKIKNGVLVKNTDGKPRVKKTVSFADNEDLCRIFSDPPEPVSNGDGSVSDGSNSIDDHVEHMDYNEIEEQRKGTSDNAKNDEVYQEQKAASSHTSNGERSGARNLRGGYSEMISIQQNEDGRLVFSPPVPVKMESRADLMQKRKTVKFVT